MKIEELNDREKFILQYVIQQFIITASPVGSRNIVKKYDLELSPATVRNIMADLEEAGYLNQPHTSAGRIPTDKGYRFYVDSLMQPSELGSIEKNIIAQGFEAIPVETDEVLKITSALLSQVTNQLACVTYPKFANAELEKIQIVRLSSTRILVVVSIHLGFVKTITLEIRSEIDSGKIESLQRVLNERLSGLNLAEIRKTFGERLKDHYNEYKPIIRVFLDSVDKIFTDVQISEKAVITGAKNILRYPEFEDLEHFQSIIELVEDKDVIIHLMDNELRSNTGDLTIKIGRENEEKYSDYSTISKEYKFGEFGGTLGIVGPKRMHYSKVVSAIVYIAETLSKEFRKEIRGK